jgi:choline dehydrogenase
VIYSAEREIGPPPADCWAAESHLFWRSQPGLVAPDIQPIHFSVPLYESWISGPPNGFSMLGGLVRPVSRGTLRSTSADPHAQLALDPRALSCAADVDAVEAAVNLCREMLSDADGHQRQHQRRVAGDRRARRGVRRRHELGAGPLDQRDRDIEDRLERRRGHALGRLVVSLGAV